MFYSAARTTSKWEKNCKTSENLTPEISKQSSSITTFNRTLTEIYGGFKFKTFYNTCQVHKNN